MPDPDPAAARLTRESFCIKCHHRWEAHPSEWSGATYCGDCHRAALANERRVRELEILLMQQSQDKATDIGARCSEHGAVRHARCETCARAVALSQAQATIQRIEQDVKRGTERWYQQDHRISERETQLAQAQTTISELEARLRAVHEEQEAPKMKYGCKHCGRDFAHEPETLTIPGIPARTHFFCSMLCREEWSAGRLSAESQLDAVKQQLPNGLWTQGYSLARCVEDLRMDRDLFARQRDDLEARLRAVEAHQEEEAMEYHASCTDPEFDEWWDRFGRTLDADARMNRESMAMAGFFAGKSRAEPAAVVMEALRHLERYVQANFELGTTRDISPAVAHAYLLLKRSLPAAFSSGREFLPAAGGIPAPHPEVKEKKEDHTRVDRRDPASN